MRHHFMARPRGGDHTVDPGLILVDMLANFDKIGSPCSNIAQAMAGQRRAAADLPGQSWPQPVSI